MTAKEFKLDEEVVIVGTELTGAKGKIVFIDKERSHPICVQVITDRGVGRYGFLPTELKHVDD